MLQTLSKPRRIAAAEPLSVSLARDAAELREAQRLRYQVFCDELGARLNTREAGIDADMYDRWCDHLIVREHAGGRVIGTYRILGPQSARNLGGYYSDEEFDLTRLDHLRANMAELGRCCVHRDYRNGVAISLLWAGITQYMRQRGHTYLMGCASIGMSDGGALATDVYHQLQAICPCPGEYRVFPRLDLPLHTAASPGAGQIPPLINAYARLGAWVCGAPAWDPDFNTADLLMLLPLSRLNPRYLRRFEQQVTGSVLHTQLERTQP